MVKGCTTMCALNFFAEDIHQTGGVRVKQMEQTDIASQQTLMGCEVLVIREATLNDLPLLIEQRRHMYQDMGYPDNTRMEDMEHAFGLWLHDNLEDGHYRNWIVETTDGQIAAGAGLWLVEWPPQMMDFSPYRGYIMNVYTEPGFRKRGLARQLVQTILSWCSAQGIHTVSLHASPEGRPVYESLGFCPSNEMRLPLP